MSPSRPKSSPSTKEPIFSSSSLLEAFPSMPFARQKSIVVGGALLDYSIIFQKAQSPYQLCLASFLNSTANLKLKIN